MASFNLALAINCLLIALLVVLAVQTLRLHLIYRYRARYIDFLAARCDLDGLYEFEHFMPAQPMLNDWTKWRYQDFFEEG